MYAVILAAAFALLVSIDKPEVVFHAPDRKTLACHLAFFVFLWMEWIWTEHYFQPGNAGGHFRVVLNTFVHAAQLWCISFCFIFFIRGKPSVDTWHNAFPVWFALYLFCVIFWGILNPKPLFEQLFTLLNAYAFLLFVAIWLLDLHFKLNLEVELRRGILGYMLLCLVVRTVSVPLVSLKSQLLSNDN
jgi:hypothetical protein